MAFVQDVVINTLCAKEKTILPEKELPSAQKSLSSLIEESIKPRKWIPSIIMPGEDGIKSDFVPMLDPSPSDETRFLLKGYPKNASFYFFDITE